MKMRNIDLIIYCSKYKYRFNLSVKCYHEFFLFGIYLYINLSNSANSQYIYIYNVITFNWLYTINTGSLYSLIPPARTPNTFSKYECCFMTVYCIWMFVHSRHVYRIQVDAFYKEFISMVDQQSADIESCCTVNTWQKYNTLRLSIYYV